MLLSQFFDFYVHFVCCSKRTHAIVRCLEDEKTFCFDLLVLWKNTLSRAQNACSLCGKRSCISETGHAKRSQNVKHALFLQHFKTVQVFRLPVSLLVSHPSCHSRFQCERTSFARWLRKEICTIVCACLCADESVTIRHIRKIPDSKERAQTPPHSLKHSKNVYWTTRSI